MKLKNLDVNEKFSDWVKRKKSTLKEYRDLSVGATFDSPRDRHKIIKKFDTPEEGRNTEGFGYWFTTDDDYDVFAYKGHGHEIGVAPSNWRLQKEKERVMRGIQDRIDKGYDSFTVPSKYKTQAARFAGDEYEIIDSRDDSVLFARKNKQTKMEKLLSKQPEEVLVEEWDEEDDLEGWDEDRLSNTLDALKDIDKLQYELESTVKGYYSDCHTYEELGKYVKNLAEALIEAVDRDLDLDESLNTKMLTEDTEGEVPPTPTVGPDTGLTFSLNELMKSEYDAIDMYNSAIVNAQAENRQDIVDILSHIANDEQTHVGNLMKATSLVNPQTVSIEDGVREADEIINEEGEI